MFVEIATAFRCQLGKHLKVATCVCCLAFLCFLGISLQYKSVQSLAFQTEIGKSIAENDRNHLYLQYVNSVATLERMGATKKQKRLPDVIGIGVEKCGTGPLRWMLLNHPMIVSSNPAEMHFFDTLKYRRGAKYYKSLMPEVASYEILFEKTPAYFNQGSQFLPRIMKQIVPKAKLLVILCDPVNRTFSDYVQEIRMQSIGLNTVFETLVMQILATLSQMPSKNDSQTTDFIFRTLGSSWKSHILSTGLYYYHLLRWYESYERSEIHIVDGEELLTDPGSALEKVQTFLKLPKLILKEDFVLNPSGFYCINAPKAEFTPSGLKLTKQQTPSCMLSKSKGRTRMGKWKHKPSQNILDSLRRFYAPHNQKLFTLLGRKFNWQQPTYAIESDRRKLSPSFQNGTLHEDPELEPTPTQN